MPSDSRPITFLSVIYGNYSANSLENNVFQQLTLISLLKVTKGQSDYANRSATYDFPGVFYSNYCAISHRTRVFQQMALIWPFKVIKGWTEFAIRSATHDSTRSLWKKRGWPWTNCNRMDFNCGLVVSTPAWDGTGCEFDSWQCRIYIPCSLSLRLLGSLRGSLGTYGLTQKLC